MPYPMVIWSENYSFYISFPRIDDILFSLCVKPSTISRKLSTASVLWIEAKHNFLLSEICAKPAEYLEVQCKY